MDIYNHAVIMRHVSPFHKLLLMMQIQIAAFVCRLNAEITAGQDSVIDILMNAAGLLILNQIDEIFLMLFLPCRLQEKDEECCEIIIKRTRNFDRMFGFIMSTGHFLYMGNYLIGFTTPSELITHVTNDLLNYGPYGFLFMIYGTLFYLLFYGIKLGLGWLKEDLFTCGTVDSANLRALSMSQLSQSVVEEIEREEISKEVLKAELDELEEKFAGFEIQMKSLSGNDAVKSAAIND